MQIFFFFPCSDIWVLTPGESTVIMFFSLNDQLAYLYVRTGKHYALASFPSLSFLGQIRLYKGKV